MSWQKRRVKGSTVVKIMHVVSGGRIPQKFEEAGLSGLARVPLEIGIRQVQQGHEVVVAVLGSRVTWTARWQGVRIDGVRGVGGLKGPWPDHVSLLRLVHRVRPDLVHSHGYAYLRGIDAPRKVIHYHSNPLVTVAGRARSRVQRDMRVAARHADVRIAVSQFVADPLRELVPDRPVHVLSNGVDAKLYFPADRERQRRRGQLGVPDSAIAFLYVGAIVPEKGLSKLVDAFISVAPCDDRLVLLIAGGTKLWSGRNGKLDETYQQRIEGRIRHVGLSPRVRWLGVVSADEMPAVYRAADALVSLSPIEGFPMNVLEGMATGLPVVISSLGGSPEAVGQAGVKVDPDNLTEVVKALVTMTDPLFRAQYGRMSLARSKELSWEKTVQTLDVIYEDTLRSIGQSTNVFGTGEFFSQRKRMW